MLSKERLTLDPHHWYWGIWWPYISQVYFIYINISYLPMENIFMSCFGLIYLWHRQKGWHTGSFLVKHRMGVTVTWHEGGLRVRNMYNIVIPSVIPCTESNHDFLWNRDSAVNHWLGGCLSLRKPYAQESLEMPCFFDHKEKITTDPALHINTKPATSRDLVLYYHHKHHQIGFLTIVSKP